MTLLERFLKGDIRALSKLISVVENRKSGYRPLLASLYQHAGNSIRIGFTGPPGAGKSTLVNTIASRFLAEGKGVGVVAVDPTSPFTGGALLGDRIRIANLAGDRDFFFRSMATRGASGGLAEATDHVSILYDAFGFDITLIETVGVGQVELDITDNCDVVVVVLVPESGDSVQTMKAGLMEIADIFCINKADRPGADRIATDIRQALQSKPGADDKYEPDIITTEAVHNKNIDSLFQTIVSYVQRIKENGSFERKRDDQLRRRVLNILKNRFRREFLDRVLSDKQFDMLLNKIRSGQTNPFDVGDELYQKFASGVAAKQSQK